MHHWQIERFPSHFEVAMKALWHLGEKERAIELIFDMRFEGIGNDPKEQLMTALHILK